MKSTYSALVQSRFFNPAFNSAIFDGPVRIYFSQFYESMALKLYFAIQEKLSELLLKAKSSHRNAERNILIMFYPNQESFEISFEGAQGFLARDILDGDILMGINGPFEDSRIPEVVQAVASAIQDSIQKWEAREAEQVSSL